MKLVLITGHYPYKPGEEFLVQEIEVLSKHFNEILIISEEKDLVNRKIAKMPKNVKYVVVNKNYKKIRNYLSALIEMFSSKTIREIIFAKNVLKYNINFKMLKSIFIYYALSNNKILWIKEKLISEKQDYLFYSYWLTNGAYALAKLRKNEVINFALSRAHGGDAFLDRGYLPFRREIYRYLDEIHFVSEQGKINFEKSIVSDISETKLLVSRLGVKKTNSKINPQDNKEKDVFHIVSCSNIIFLKRLDLIVEALTLINESRIKWTHIGDGEKKNYILELINKKLNKKNIEIEFLGYLDNVNILNFYGEYHIDLFINVSDYEGVPVSIMEAFSFGIPAIARNVGGNREIITNNYNGFLLEKEVNARIVTDTILKVLKMSKQEVNQIRENAYETWKENYNSNINYEVFAKNLSVNYHKIYKKSDYNDE